MSAAISYREAIARAMRSALQKNPRSFIYGLGVTDHIGIFGTTLGLREEFGAARVVETPIAEEAMTGLGVGASLGGLYPIHVHIRNDFMLLGMNQIVNHAAKYRSMYGGAFELPMLIRAVIGRSWGQGGQHSQSLQALFAHVPGLTLVMPSCAASLLRTYDHAVNECRSPVLAFEHRLLYDYTFNLDAPAYAQGSPLGSFLVRAGRDVTIVASSVMVLEAQRAADFVRQKAGVEAEIIDLHCVSHPDADLIMSSVRKTGRLIVADTGWACYGVCAEVAHIVASRDPSVLKAPVIDISMAKTTCPTSKALEKLFYPDLRSLVDAIYRLVPGGRDRELPSEEFVKAQYKEFRGPF